MTTKKASKSGATRVTANLDAIASLFQNHHVALGIPQKVASDFSYRCDLLSDSIDRRKQAGYFDPAEIGEEVPGPLMFDPNNPFMKGEFTQERFTQLAAKQMSGELAANAAKHIADPKLAAVVRKAAYAAAMSMAAKFAAEDAPSDEKDADEAEDEKAEKTAARLAARRAQAKKSEDEAEAEDEAEKEIEEGEEPEEKAEEEAKKTAALFGLFLSSKAR